MKVLIVAGKGLKLEGPQPQLDPCVEVQIGPTVHLTGICINTANPVWKEAFALPAVRPEDLLHVRAINAYDASGDVIGQVLCLLLPTLYCRLPILLQVRFRSRLTTLLLNSFGTTHAPPAAMWGQGECERKPLAREQCHHHRECREVRTGKTGRSRARGGDRQWAPLPTQGKGFKQRTRVSGDRPIRAPGFRQQTTQASCPPVHTNGSTMRGWVPVVQVRYGFAKGS